MSSAGDGDSMPPPSPHVYSLTRSFSLVPPAAVPAIVDCVLASSPLTPSQLFSSLLHSFPDLKRDLVKEDHSKLDPMHANFVVAYATALFHLVKTPQASPDALRLFICGALMPLLRVTSPNDNELLNKIEEILCDAVTAFHSWDLVEAKLVPLCMRSVGLSVGMLRSKESAIYQWGIEESSELGSLPLTIAFRVLISLLDASLRARAPQGAPGEETESLDGLRSSEVFARKLIWDLAHMAVDMLSQCLEHRSHAIRFLLPLILRALGAIPLFDVSVHGLIHIFSRDIFLRDIWKRCTSLFSFGHLERLDAYNILSLCLSFIFNVEGHETVAAEEFDIRAEKEFWEEIRRGLVDKDASARKLSLYILKMSLWRSSLPVGPQVSKSFSKNAEMISHDGSSLHSGMTRREKWADEEAKSLGVGEICSIGDDYLNGLERWKAFLLLYEMLEEYGTHLIEAAWTHQISLLFQSAECSSILNSITGGLCQFQMETLEGLFSWLAVLWERGFIHENPQVRCLIMQSFLGVDWENHVNFANQVPKRFVLGPFILGLNDVVHHKDFGIKGVYTSKTIKGATKFLHQYASCFSNRERLAFLCSLASVTRQESFGRVGLMALAFCLSSAASGTELQNRSEGRYCGDLFPHIEQLESTQQDQFHDGFSELLDVLTVVIERSKQHFNPSYRLQVSEQVLEAVSSVMCTSCVPLDVLLHFLSTIPREFTDIGGALRRKMQHWFSWRCDRNCCCNSIGTGVEVLRNLCTFPMSFIKRQLSPEAVVSFDDEDLVAWGFEAQRWARVLFLIISKEHQLVPIYKVLQNYGCSISKQEGSLDWFPFKYLILTISLVEELQMGWKKWTCSGVKLDMTDILGQLSQPESSIVFGKFGDTFLLILGHLLSYANSVGTIFWSVPLEKDAVLPSSVRGKLGGPSQRRLASLTATSVLQAILSMKIVASILSWITQSKAVACMSSWTIQSKTDACLSSLFAFLWNFSWKVILSPTYNAEAGAEIHLAAYEALVPALKTLSTAFSPWVFDFIKVYNKSSFLNGEEDPLLDPLLLNFLQNVNNILVEGDLTRSRQAVLRNWKWLCVDSLLSIPYNVNNTGVHPRTSYAFFSDSALRNIFSDIVESLENAGETSVLPMLRSVRLIIGLLCSGRKNELVSLCDGINLKMMHQLVQSSWILHLNCNKRKVAPIAALLSSVLHPSVFGDPSMHEMDDNRQGPLKWFIEKLLSEGVKSPRTIRLAALHLTGLWFSYPQTIKYYIKELMLLSLYGSVAFDEDFEAELSENQEVVLEVSVLARSPDAELAELFINTELYARVAVAVLFYKLADMGDNVGDKMDNEDAQSALHAGRIFLLELLDSVVNDKDLAKELYKKYSGVHRRKVRAWQMICILSRFVDKDIVQQVTTFLHICLYRNNLPAVRQYLETFAIQIYLKFPALVEEQLIPIFHDYTMRPQALSSYVFISANIILHSSELPVQLGHLNVLLPPIIPLLTSHHHSLRGVTQLLVYNVLSKLVHTLEPNSMEGVPLEKKCFMDLKSYLAENIDCVRLRASMEGFLDAFDPKTVATPVAIFNPRNEGSDFECVPISLMEQVITFLNEVREDLRYSMAKDIMTIKNEGLEVGGTCKISLIGNRLNGETSLPQILGDLTLDFQKKVTLYKHEHQPLNTDVNSFSGHAEFPRLLTEMEKEDQLLGPTMQSRSLAMGRLRGSRQQFVLVASLIDRIPNLAGLARSCEVFKVAGLAISDTSIVHDKQFQLISVTADKWVPIIEVPVCSIKVFLEKKRREGFSILGLEQTANSIPLDQYSFSERTVLVLGREKEGIPVDIIHCLDACVEIPQ